MKKPKTKRQALGLTTKAYHLFRLRVLYEEPHCQRCNDKGHITASKQLHHIKPIASHPELAWDRENVQAICEPCHEEETRKQVARVVKPIYCSHGFRIDIGAGTWLCVQGCEQEVSA